SRVAVWPAGRNRNWVAGSSSWCSTFPGTQRSQGASHSALPGGTVSREWPGRDEHWLVRISRLVRDVPSTLDTLGGLDARHYRGVRCQGSDPGRTSTSSSTPNTRQLPQPVKLNSSPSTPALITAPG